MNNSQIIEAFNTGTKIHHTKRGSFYRILAIGEMDTPEGWVPSATYQCTTTDKVYTRRLDEFHNFVMVVYVPAQSITANLGSFLGIH